MFGAVPCVQVLFQSAECIVERRLHQLVTCGIEEAYTKVGIPRPLLSGHRDVDLHATRPVRTSTFRSRRMLPFPVTVSAGDADDDTRARRPAKASVVMLAQGPAR